MRSEIALCLEKFDPAAAFHGPRKGELSVSGRVTGFRLGVADGMIHRGFDATSNDSTQYLTP
jgi:hypothetical protein